MTSTTIVTMPHDELPPPRASSAKSEDSWSEYNFDWLFDPSRIDHLPIEEQIKYYKQRNLGKSKLFKVASKIWGGPVSRKRVIIAAPMHSQEGEITTFPVPVQSNVMTSALKPQLSNLKPPSTARLQAKSEQEKIDQYHDWIKERQEFRTKLESMGLNENWLINKPDKTALEKRVLAQMIAEKNPRLPSPPQLAETPLQAILPEETPVVKRPSPQAIRLIEKFLCKKKMRLIDLFQKVDKDKDWMVTRDEFRKAVHEADIPLSETQLEDLILALDTDLNNELDYRELAKGMGLWKIEKRESKAKMIANSRVSISPDKYSQISGFEPPEQDIEYKQMDRSHSNVSPTRSLIPGGKSDSPNRFAAVDKIDGEIFPTGDSPTGMKSSLSRMGSGSGSQYLEVPKGEIREEQLLTNDEAMLDVRKRDKETLSRYNSSRKSNSGGSKRKSSNSLQQEGRVEKTMISTGDPAVDSHCKPSTLCGETGELVDKFRQLKLKEFDNICKLCAHKNVPFTESLLKKVLLFPRDRPHSQLQKKLRQPAQPLLTLRLAEPQSKKRSNSPTFETSKYKMKGKSHGRLMPSGFAAYPNYKKSQARETKMNLSTGKAMITRQVDCWLSFEEYERLTSNMARTYKNLHGSTDDNAFWPGRLLDKLRLCMDDPPSNTGAGAVFMNTRQRPS